MSCENHPKPPQWAVQGSCTARLLVGRNVRSNSYEQSSSAPMMMQRSTRFVRLFSFFPLGLMGGSQAHRCASIRVRCCQIPAEAVVPCSGPSARLGRMVSRGRLMASVCAIPPPPATTGAAYILRVGPLLGLVPSGQPLNLRRHVLQSRGDVACHMLRCCLWCGRGACSM